MSRHTPGNYVPLDVNYPRDRAIRKAGPDAELLFVRGLAYAKGARTDGFVPDYDLDVAAAGLRNVRRSVGRLVAEGLWVEVNEGWRIRSWLNWNRPVADEDAFHETQGQHGSKGNHERWHVQKGVTSEDCPHCTNPTPQPDRVPDPQPDRQGESPIREGKGREGNNPSASAVAEREFDEFWSLYPKRKDKGHALKAFKAARKSADLDAILSGVRRHLAQEWRDKAPEFIPYPATWLNGQRWLDEPTNVRPFPGADPDDPSLLPPVEQTWMRRR